MWIHLTFEQTLSLIGTALAGIICFVSVLTFMKVSTVHILMNSRLTELLKAEKGASRAEGAAQERELHEAATTELARMIRAEAAKVAAVVVQDAAEVAKAQSEKTDK